jgi:hypothetical protein
MIAISCALLVIANLESLTKYAIGVSNRFEQAHRLTGKGTFELSPFDGVAYSKFVLAVLWRASTSERPKLRNFSLGKHEERIRNIIFGSSELDSLRPLKILVQRLTSTHIPDVSGFYTLPFQIAFEGTYLSYQFSVGGFSISTILDGRPISNELAPFVIDRSGLLRGKFKQLEDTHEFRAMTHSVVAEAARRGRRPSELNRKMAHRRR